MIVWGLAGAGILLMWAALTGRSPSAIITAVLNGAPLPHGHRLTEAEQVIGTGTFEPATDRDNLANFALQQLGKPYRWGAVGPDAFDCSGLTLFCYKRVAGIDLPRTAAQQAAWNRSLKTTKPMNGDLVFRGVPAYHVGIYYNGQYINAPDVGQNVKVSPIPRDAYIRYVTDNDLGGGPRWEPPRYEPPH